MNASADPPLEGVALGALSRPVRGGNTFEETLERLLQQIRLGLVPPGESLPPERELAARLEVSRDTVREAIHALVDAGYVESRRGRYGGTFVLEPLSRPEERLGERLEQAEVDDVLVLREILEVGAARAAAGRSLLAAERDQLAGSMRETAAAVTAEDYRRLDSRLHLTLAELSGSPTLVTLVADNRMLVNALLDRIPLFPPNITHSNEQHERVVWSVLSGDAEGAAAAMTEHVEGTASLLRGFLV